MVAVFFLFFATRFEFPASVIAMLLALGGIVLAARALLAAARLPTVTIDGSRRWVTLRGVHADFAGAVERIRQEGGLRSTV